MGVQLNVLQPVLNSNPSFKKSLVSFRVEKTGQHRGWAWSEGSTLGNDTEVPSVCRMISLRDKFLL